MRNGKTFRVTVVLLWWVSSTHAVSHGIRTDTDAFPLIINLATGRVVNWATGRVAEYLASSVAVHVSLRGVRFVHRWFTLTLDDIANETIAVQPCVRSVRALCEVAHPWQFVFPVTGAGIVFGSPNVCTEMTTRRELRLAGSNDISLCDVLSGQHTVLVTTDGRIHIKHNAIGTELQAVLSLLAVFVVGCVAQRCVGIESMLMNSRWCTAACVAILILVLATYDRGRLFVTREDMMSFWLLVGYSIFNLVRWSVRSYKEPTQPAPYSLCAGALNLLSFRLFASVDNPVSPFIMAFVAARVLQKLYTQEYRQHWAHYIDLYLDTLVAAVLAQYGFFTQYDSELRAGMHVAILFTALLVLLPVE